MNNNRELDYHILNNLALQYGDAFYILDSTRFRNNYNEMLRAFRSEYINTSIAYSYKTNYTPLLCRIVNDEGGYAEVVSEMEMYAARRIGVNYSSIYHNGPYKTERCIRELLLNGGHVNLDAKYEIGIIRKIALEHSDKEFEVGIRVSLDIGQETPSRFGFDLSNGDLQNAVSILESQPNIFVTGCHCHLPYRSLDSFNKRMDTINEIIESGLFRHLKYFSVGGGYMGHVDEDLLYSFNYQPPTYADYARVVAGRFKDIFVDKHNKVALIIEPGSALVADTMKLVARVISVKRVRDRVIATLAGSSYNMNPSVKGVNRPIRVYSKEGQGVEYNSVDLVGYTCIEGDVLYSGYKGRIQEGDYVVFSNVGSYSIVMKPPFILPDIPVVEMAERGTVSEVKHAQTAKCIFDSFVI